MSLSSLRNSDAQLLTVNDFYFNTLNTNALNTNAFSTGTSTVTTETVESLSATTATIGTSNVTTETVGTLTATKLNGITNPFIPSSTSTSYSPVMYFGGANVGWAFSSTGQYQQIGGVVFFGCSINVTTKGSSTGELAISLPVLPSSALPISITSCNYFPVQDTTFTTATIISASVAVGSATMNLSWQSTSGTVSFLSSTNILASAIVNLSGFYFVA